MLTIAQDQELDLGANRIAPGMQRHCALTRTLKPVDDMIRFVVGPGGHTVPDVKRKLPGRAMETARDSGWAWHEHEVVGQSRGGDEGVLDVERMAGGAGSERSVAPPSR